MDLLFKRYASPFSLLDNAIECDRLEDLVDGILEYSEEEKLWDIYCHTIYTNKKSFYDFIKPTKKQEPITKDDLGAMIKDSKDILKNFKPS